MRRVIPIVLALVLVVSVRTSAQLPTAQKWTDVEWYSVTTFYFSDAEEGMNLFVEHFLPVVKEVWPDVTCLQLRTGEVKMTCYGPEPEGPATLEWRVNPQEADFYVRLAEHLGEAGWELGEALDNTISRITTDIAMRHTGGM